MAALPVQMIRRASPVSVNIEPLVPNSVGELLPAGNKVSFQAVTQQFPDGDWELEVTGDQADPFFDVMAALEYAKVSAFIGRRMIWGLFARRHVEKYNDGRTVATLRPLPM